MAIVQGKYELVDSRLYDEFLKSVGAGMIERDLAWKSKPFMEYVHDHDGKWKQRTIAGVKNSEINFVPGEEFEEEFLGRKLKSKITLEGNRLIHKQRIGPVEATVTREFNGSEMVSFFQVGDTVATRVFRKIA
ncbi:Fatty acid-binding protein, muscle [Orchesella cincta]|uniref:Fatty acid-binding protein, muscle n=1 Tax=Orchesella cincta TaxID=48709 RepID=A0A1D2N2T4_ORCCI|nr:Fatty acid-binding protein, muscle [Orchesella cincta]